MEQKIFSPNKTIQYYEENALSFAETTQNVDFSSLQDYFLQKIPAGGSILDFGCGAGRDLRYFKERDFQVEGLDGSKNLCRIAASYVDAPVRWQKFEEFHEKERYDGIWACASILHLDRETLIIVLNNMKKALKGQGIIYTSFKNGDFSGYRHGRFFTDMTASLFADLLKKVPGLYIEESWLTGDVRRGRESECWLNLILRRAKG